MQRNFHIDNCLFAASIVDEAAHLIKQESTLFQNKGFNLAKWITNNESLLQILPKADRAKLIDMDGNLISSFQQVLRVLWDTTDYCFRFHVNLPKGPFTCRGLISVLSFLFDPSGFFAQLPDYCFRIFASGSTTGTTHYWRRMLSFGDVVG